MRTATRNADNIAAEGEEPATRGPSREEIYVSELYFVARRMPPGCRRTARAASDVVASIARTMLASLSTWRHLTRRP